MQPQEYDTLRALEDHHWWYAVLHRLVNDALSARLPPHARVLDAGCGTGGMMAFLHDRHPQWRLEGIDANDSAVAYSRQRGLAVQQGDVGALPHASDSFDAVLSLDVLYHAGVDEARAWDEMYRVLKPGGVLVLNLPAFDCLRGGHDAVVCGVRRYKACQVRQRLENRKLNSEMIHYWNAWLFLPLLMKRQWSRAAAVTCSDLTPPPRWINTLLGALGCVDAGVCRALSLPWGSSVFAVAVKPPTGGLAQTDAA